MKVLFLWGNSIGEAGAMQLADALRTNTSVEGLDLNYNDISEELEDSIGALLAPAARAQRKAEAVPVAVPAPEAATGGGGAAGGGVPQVIAVAAAVACAAPPALAVSAAAGGDGGSSSSDDDEEEAGGGSTES